jgi:glycosyltransferase involved in cell wall biosynthesis
MQLVLLTTSYPLIPDSPSGIFVARLAQHLSSSVVTTVVTPASSTPIAPTTTNRMTVRAFRYAPRSLQVLAQQPGGIPVALRTRRWTYLLLPGFLLSMLISCLRHTKGVDVIHANWAICGCIAGLVGRLRHVPVVTTLRGDDVTRAQRSILDRTILSLCLHWSSTVVCVSHSMDTWLRKQYPLLANKMRVIENGVEDVLLSLPLERKPVSAALPLRLVTVGSLIPRKGIDRIISALRRLPDRNAIALTVIGDGPEQVRLEQMVDTLGLRQHIRFAGTMPPSAIADELAKAHVFVFASHSEGRPNAVLEAMAAGLPVVASDIPGVNELVQHGVTGFLYQPDSADALAAHIQLLLEDADLRARFGRAGRDEIINRRLRWRMTAENYSRLYRSVSENT